MDAIYSFTISVRKQALGTVIRIIGGVSYAPLMVVRQFGGKQFVPATGGLAQLEFSYDDSMASKEIDRIVKSWKQTFRVDTGLVGNKVTMEYAVWKTRRPRDLMIPPMMEKEPIDEIPQEGPSDLEIAKQLFEVEMKKMRIKSRKQQGETEKWKKQAETHEGRLRRMFTDYGKAKKDKKRLNEEINVLERKFKYAGLRMSYGLP